ncbi:MAG TPA: TetR/AcrR family transcriptional regulator [Thermoleophilaceae bacterium]
MAGLAALSRRERMLEIGIEEFTARSYEEVSTEDVARRASVTHGLLFHHFGTKRGFFLEVMRAVATRRTERFESNPHRDPARWLRWEINTFLDDLVEHPPVLMLSGFGMDDEMKEQMQREQRHTAERILARMGIDDPSPLLFLAVRGWVGFALDSGREWLATPAVSRTRMRRLLIDSLNGTFEAVARIQPDSSLDPSYFSGA